MKLPCVTIRISTAQTTYDPNYMLREVVTSIASKKISCTAWGTLSSVGYSGDFIVEPGLSFDLFEIVKTDILYDLWPELKSKLKLECLHISSPFENFSGCIYDWGRPTNCPKSLKSVYEKVD